MELEFYVYIATSLDGFIARTDGKIDWLETANEGEEAESGADFQSFLAGMDALLMGRNTYEVVKSFAGLAWPYAHAPAYVLSSTLQAVDIPIKHKDKVILVNGAPMAVIQRLQQDGIRKVYLDGGKTIQQFLRLGLVKQLTITQIPVLIGAGIPLFGLIDNDIKLNLLATKVLDNRLSQSSYEVLPS